MRLRIPAETYDLNPPLHIWASGEHLPDVINSQFTACFHSPVNVGLSLSDFMQNKI